MAYGGFLVSGGYENGKARYVQVTSQKGRVLTLVNPWPGCVVQVFRDGKAAESMEGDILSCSTRQGESLYFLCQREAEDLQGK